MCDHRNKGQAVPAEGVCPGPTGLSVRPGKCGRGERGWPQDRLPWRPLGMASRPPRSSDTYLLEGRKWALSPTWASLALQLHDSAFTPSLCPCLSCPPQKPALSGPSPGQALKRTSPRPPTPAKACGTLPGSFKTHSGSGLGFQGTNRYSLQSWFCHDPRTLAKPQLPHL